MIALQLQIQQKLTMVDDLPHAGDPEQRRRLTELLVQLARSSRSPIAVIVTGSHAQSGGSFGGASKAGSFQGWHRVRRSSSPGCPVFIPCHSPQKLTSCSTVTQLRGAGCQAGREVYWDAPTAMSCPVACQRCTVDVSTVLCAWQQAWVREMGAWGVQEMQAALEAAGVAHISCNPITASNAAKALLHVAEAERMPLSKEQAHRLAEAASGDLRNALEMLQLLSVGQDPHQAPPKTQKVGLRERAASNLGSPEIGTLQSRSVINVPSLLDTCSLHICLEQGNSR